MNVWKGIRKMEMGNVEGVIIIRIAVSLNVLKIPKLVMKGTTIVKKLIFSKLII